MRRHLLALALPVVILLTLSSVAPSQKADEKNERFCVTIWPEKTRLNAVNPVNVKVRVVNSSDKMQSFMAWNCSFMAQWESSNPRVGQNGWSCFRNFLVQIDLQPGEAYERKLAMICEKGKSKTESFKLGFTPHGEQTVYWSNEVVVGVD